MDRARVGDLGLAYSEKGQGSETVVFSHSYLVDSRQFDAQIDELSDRYRVIAFDHRDHGRSDRCPSEYSLDDLVNDAIGVIETLAAAPCHFVGLSTGGFVGMRIALRRPDLLQSLTLMDTDAASEQGLARLKNRFLLMALRTVGIKPLLSTAMKTMFSSNFLNDPGRSDDAATWRGRIAANDGDALSRFGNAIFVRDDVLEQLRSVDVPTLVVHGSDDRALPVAHATETAAAIPNARLEIVSGAGHLCTIEQPSTVNAILNSFLQDQAQSHRSD